MATEPLPGPGVENNSYENNTQASIRFHNPSSQWSRILTAIGSLGEGGGTIGSAFHFSPMLRICPPFAYCCYAFAEFLRGIYYLILVCVPSSTYDRSEIRSLSSLIIGAISHFTITACYVLTALIFIGILGTPALGWVLAAVATSMGWAKNDIKTERCYTGLLVAVGMIILAVNAFVFSPVLLPSLGMSYIAAVGYACMVPSFLKGVASTVEMICYLGKKLYEYGCRPRANRSVLTEELSPRNSPRTRSHSLSSSSSSSSPRDSSCYNRVWAGHPPAATRQGEVDEASLEISEISVTPN